MKNKITLESLELFKGQDEKTLHYLRGGVKQYSVSHDDSGIGDSSEYSDTSTASDTSTHNDDSESYDTSTSND